MLCRRGGTVESTHRIHAAVTDADGRLRARVGNPDRMSFCRSAAKPLQALAVVEEGAADRFGITDGELAVCCASHNSEPRHLEAAASILERAGLGPPDLECGPHPPLRREVADRLVREGVTLRPIHNNCSGKHAGMLALAAARDWPTQGYVGASHPVQRRMLREVARWSGIPEEEIGTATDGCGVQTFAVPLAAMARAVAGLTAAAGTGDPGPRRVVDAMTAHPFLVAGTGRLDTELMRAVDGRIVVKTGAEGIFVAGLRDRGLGVALKVEDGARRASESALVHVLDELGALRGDELERLAGFHRPPVRNTRDEVVGRVESDFTLERC